jgi:hypothetical protein
MVFQTLTMPGTAVLEDTDGRGIDDRSDLAAPGWPKMVFIEHRFANDPTNWWAPNHAAVLAMLHSTGMRVVEQPAHEMYLCAPDPGWEDNPDRSFPLAWRATRFSARTIRGILACLVTLVSPGVPGGSLT